MAFGGVALKSTSIFIRGIEFLGSLAVLGIFTYYLVYLPGHEFPTYTWVRAVEGLSGASALYTFIAFLLTCCLGGVMFFAFVGILLDILFIGAWIAIAILTREGGTASCSALKGNASSSFRFYTGSAPVSFGNESYRICILEKSAFGIAVGVAVLFLFSALVQLAMGKHHQAEKRNSHPNTPLALTEKKRFWQRKNKGVRGANRDVETAGADFRPSHDTSMTGATATDQGAVPMHSNVGTYKNKYGQSLGSEGYDGTTYGRAY